jgi:Flp pilus assembly pilin Flp
MRLRFGRIETYVMGYTLLAVLAALAILTTVVALVDFVELSRTVGNRVDVSYNEVLRLTALNLPSIILVLLPFAFLFGVLGAFVDLNRKSELIAMRAAGVSAWRFILPAAGDPVQSPGLDPERPVRARAERARRGRAVARTEGYLAAPGRRQHADRHPRPRRR